MRWLRLLLGATAYGQAQATSPPPPHPPQSYYQVAETFTNRWGPNDRECYTANGVLATSPSAEWSGTLEEAKQRCSVTPDCTAVYDWACDGAGWKYCKLVSKRAPAGSCGYSVAPNPPPAPPSPPLPSIPPAQGASGGITIHFPPPPAPPGGFGEAPCAGA